MAESRTKSGVCTGPRAAEFDTAHSSENKPANKYQNVNDTDPQAGEATIGEKEGPQDRTVPIPPKRRKKKSLSSKFDSVYARDKDIEGANEEIEEAACYEKTMDETVKEVIDMKSWKLELVRLENASAMEKMQVKMFTQENKIIVEGVKKEVIEICNLIYDLDQNITDCQIKLEDNGLKEFLQTETVREYINELMLKRHLNCYWEVNREQPVVDLHLCGRTRQQEACDTFETSYCKNILHVDRNLRKTTLWREKVNALTNTFNGKACYLLGDNADEVTVFCTSDLKQIAVDNLVKVEEEIEKIAVLKLKPGIFMVYQQTGIRQPPGVELITLPEQHCIVLDGDEDSVQATKLRMYQSIQNIVVQKLPLLKIIPTNFFKTNDVESFINANLKNKQLTVHWKVNDHDSTIDVSAFHDKLQEACDVIKQSYCMTKCEFGKNMESLELFKSKTTAMMEKCLGKLKVIIDEQEAIIICTSDLLPQIKEVCKSSENVAISIAFQCKTPAIYIFLKANQGYLNEIKENQSVSVSFSDENCELNVQGRKTNIEAAKVLLQDLVNQTIVQVPISVSKERLMKFQKGDYEQTCKEIEINFKVYIHSLERDFDDICFKLDDRSIVLTNKWLTTKGISQTNMVLAKDDIEETHLKVILDETESNKKLHCPYTLLRSKMEGGKNIEKFFKLFERIFEAADKSNIGTLVVPVEDLVACERVLRFVKLFIRAFNDYIKGHKMCMLDLVFEVRDRNSFRITCKEVKEYINSIHYADSKKDRIFKTIPIKLEVGELAKAKADVIVDSVGRDLDLNQAAVSKSLLEAAGKELQLEIRRNSPGGLHIWHMVMTHGYNLPCQRVYHVVIEGYHGESPTASSACLQAFETLIYDCLCSLESQGFTSIAFPVLGTGNLEYTTKHVADVMMNAAENYSRRNPSTHIQTIMIFLYPKGSDGVKKVLNVPDYKVFLERLKTYPKQIALKSTDRMKVKDDPEHYYLVIVGTKDHVAPAKRALIEKFKAEDGKNEEDYTFSENGKSVLDIKSEDKAASFTRTSDLKTLKVQTPNHAGDISHLDKLLGEVKVEVKEGFVNRLPDKVILQILGFFDVSVLFEENKYWLKGKMTHLEKVRDFLKSIVISPEHDQIKRIDISRDVYNFICSKPKRFTDRISYNPNTNEVIILELDKAFKELIDQYKDYQFDELLLSSENRDSTGNIDAERDQKAAETLLLDKSHGFHTVEYVLNTKDRKLIIAGPDYSKIQEFKFAFEVQTGRKQVRSRQSRAEPPAKYPVYKADDVSTHAYPERKTEMGHYRTKEGVIVHVYKHDILKLNVECIVNAANREMEHGGGVAKVIAKAAGYELEKESRLYIKKNGYLKVGSCCTTTAGKLSYKCVIHTVGPNIKDYRESEYSKMRKELRQAVRVCFLEAGKRKYRSIGMTSVSSGIYGVSKSWCANEYSLAVDEFSKEHGSTTLKEIHFVDVNDEMLGEMNKAFSSHFKRENETKIENREHDSGQYPKCYERDCKWYFELKADFKVIVYTGDILQFGSGAVACCQDLRLSCTGRLACALKQKAGPTFDKSLQKEKYTIGNRLKIGDVVVTSHVGLICAAVFHVVLPDLTTQIGQRLSESFRKDFHTGYVNCLQKAHQRGISKIAFPLFGCGILEDKVDILVEEFKQAVIGFIYDTDTGPSAFREVHVINNMEGVTHKIKKAFIDYVESTSVDNLSENTGTEYHRDVVPFKSDNMGGSEEHIFPKGMEPSEKLGKVEILSINGDGMDVKCPICMDSYDKPFKLPKCGHVFCSECIEAQFKVSPKCPNCFMVYGIITGDQPEGEMRDTVDRYIKLRGFDGCNTIVVKYSFPDGIQGPNHPQPGVRYKGIRRTAYLPDNKDGRLVLKLLKIAFERKLVFTIGSSRTTGQEGVITWNDIHHKTDTRPHSTFGYPDPTYLERVKDELAAKGVTADNVS